MNRDLKLLSLLLWSIIITNFSILFEAILFQIAAVLYKVCGCKLFVCFSLKIRCLIVVW